HRVVVLGRVLDLVLGAMDEDLLLVMVDVTNDAGREHHLLAEDPRAGIDNDQRAVDVKRSVVNLADRPIDRLDAIPNNTGGASLDACTVRPHVSGCAHLDSFRGRIELARIGYP